MDLQDIQFLLLFCIYNQYILMDLCNFLYWFGFNKEKARNKIIPDRLFKLSRENVVNFIRGMFDGDGCSYYKKSKNNALKVLYWSTSKQIIDTLQIILLNFGIICSQSWTLTKPTKKVKVSSYCGKIEIGLGYSKKFMELIGFKLQRKNKEYFSRCSQKRNRKTQH